MSSFAEFTNNYLGNSSNSSAKSKKKMTFGELTNNFLAQKESRTDYGVTKYNELVSAYRQATDSASKDNDKWHEKSYYSNQSDYLKSLEYKKKELENYFKNNGQKYSKDFLAQMNENLKNLSVMGTSLQEANASTDNFYSQWEDENSYNNWVSAEKIKKEQLALDIPTAKKEVEEIQSRLATLDNQIKGLKSNEKLLNFSALPQGQIQLNDPYTAYSKTNNAEMLSKYKEEYAKLSDELASKKQYLTTAERLQSNAKLVENAKNSVDFEQFSAEGLSLLKNISNDNSLSDEKLRDLGMIISGNASAVLDAHLMDSLFSTTGVNRTEDSKAKFDAMTEDEKKVYAYYLGKRDTENEKAYLENLDDTLNQRIATGIYEEQYKDNIAAEMFFGVKAGLNQNMEGMVGFARQLTGNEDYQAPSGTDYVSAFIRDDLGDEGAIHQGAYDLITTTSNMMPSILTSTLIGTVAPVAGKVVGAGMMGMSASGSAYQEMINLGYNKEQARTYGMLVGASETTLESLLGGISKFGGALGTKALPKVLTTKFAKAADTAIGNIAIKYGSSMLSEFSEESLQEILDPVFQNIAVGYNLNKLSDIELSDVLYAGILGALSAGIFESPGVISDVSGSVNTAKIGQDVKKFGNINDLKTIANTLSADSAAYQIAGKVNEKSSAYTIGKLFNEVGATLSEGNVESIKNNLVGRGMSQNDAQVLAEAYAYGVVNDTLTLTPEQEEVFKNNEVIASAVHEELISNNKKYNEQLKRYIEITDNVLNKRVAEPTHNSTESTAEKVEDVKTDNSNNTTENASETDFSKTTYNGEEVSYKYKSHNAVKLDNGETVDIEDLALSDDDAFFYETVTGKNDILPEARFVNGKLTDGVDVVTANEIREIFGGTPTPAQLQGVGMYFRYGMYNINRVDASVLTDLQRKQVFNLGRAFGEYLTEKESKKTKVKQYSKGKVKYNIKNELNTRQQASVEVIEKLADMFDITFNLYESTLNGNGERLSVMPDGKETTANGYYMNGEIYIDINAGNQGQGAMLYTAAHELAHYIKEWSPKKFKVLADFLVEQYQNKGKNVDYYVNKQMEKARRAGNKNMKYSAAFEEFVADSMEKMLADEKAVEKLVALRIKDKTVFDKLREGIRKLVDRIKQEYAKLAPDSAEGRTVAKMTDVFSDIQDLFLEALDDASNNFQKAEKNTATNDGVKYQVREDFSQQLQDWKNGAGKPNGKYNGKYFDLGTTSNMLIKHGAPNANLIMYEDCLIKVTGGKHSISLDEISKLPYELDDPVLLFKGSVENSFVALTEMIDKQGNDVIVAIHINKKYGRNVINKIASIYSKSDDFGNNKINNYISQQIQNGNLIDASKNKASMWFTSRGLQLPKLVQTIIDANNSVSQENTTVNNNSMQETRKNSLRDSNGRELSAEQAEFFKDAKTRDNNGKLKPFYHGTGRADRVGTIFRADRATAGPMAYFTDSQDIADNYASDKKDTSIDYDSIYDSYEEQFRVIHNGKDINIVDLWKTFSANEKNTIREKAKHITLDDDWENVIYSKETQNGLGNFDAYEINAHNGNVLHTLVDSWLTDGNIYGEEYKFLDVLKLLGIENAKYMDPDFRAEKTYQVYLNITNPFDTSNVSKEMFEALKSASKTAEHFTGNIAYLWDKRNITPKHWIELLEDDISNGTTYVWTRIPDFVTTVLKEYGYDGILDKGGKGSGSIHEVAIPFYSNQIKNVDNLNPTTNDDIRFSERGQSVYELLGENKRLQKENNRLKDKNEYLNQLLKLQRKITHGKIIDRKTVEKQANILLKNTQSKMDKKDLTDQLYAFYTYIIGSEQLVWEDVLNRAGWIANDLLNAVPQKVQRDEYAQEILSFLHNTKISLNDVQKAEAENLYGSFSVFRKTLFGSVIISDNGTSLDSVWQELSEKYPETFSKETNPADMPIELADIILNLRDTTSLIEEYDQTQQMRYLAEQIYDGYWNVSTVQTVMDKLSAENRREIQELKYRYAKKVAEMKKQHEKELSDQKAYYREMVNRVRIERNTSHKKQMMDYKAKVLESHARAIEKRNNTVKRNQILKTLDSMEKKLLNQRKEKNIGIEMQPLACRLLTMINLDTVDADFRLDRINSEMENTENPQLLSELQAKADRIKQQGTKKADELYKKRNMLKDIDAYAKRRIKDMGAESRIDDVVIKTLDDIEALLGGTPIRRMNSYQLECLKNAVDMVDGYIKKDKELFLEGKNQTVEDAANAVMNEVSQNSKGRKEIIKQLEWLQKSGWAMLKPETAFDLIGSDTLKNLFNEARKGDDKFALSISDAKKFSEETVQKYGADKWDMEKKYDFNLISGEKVTLTFGEVLSLYAYSKRDQAIPHLEGGGFVQVEPVKKKIGKLNIEYTVNEDHAHRLTEAELGSIINSLSKEQKAFADEMQKYLSSVMGKKGNEISMALYQIDIFKEKNYFPLKLCSVYKYFQKNENSKTPLLKNAGMTKPTVEKANDPIVIESFQNVWANHVIQMSRYNAYVLGIENLTKVFGYTSFEKSSVRAALQGAYGEAAIEYIENFIIDLNGGRKGYSHRDMVNISSKLLNNFKKVTVSASLSTAIQQPSAIIRAMSYVKPKYFMMKKDEKISHKENWEELKKYAPIATLKEIGGFDMSAGVNVADYLKQRDYKGKEKLIALAKDSKYRDDLLMWGASKADEIAWSSLWNAIKKEQRYRFPNMEKEKFLKICGERFTDVATKTQVYDSVFTRSEIMRSPNEINKMASAFMGEPMTNLNIIVDTIIQRKRGKISRMQAGANIGCVYLAQIVAAASASIVYAMRDDDDDESFVEKYMSAFGGKLTDELLPITWIPYVRDVISLCQGYDVSRTDMSVISDIVDSVKDLKSKSLSTFDKISGIAGSFAAAFGLPLKNLIRDGKAIYNAINMTFDSNVPKSGDASKAFAEGIFGEKNMAKANDYLSKGKTEKANKIIADLLEDKTEKNISNGKTPEKAEKDAKSSIRSSLTSYWKPLFIKAYREDDYIEQEEIYNLLNSTGIYGTSDELEDTIERWIKDLE